MTNQAAPTSAPTEQDRARAQAVVAQWHYEHKFNIVPLEEFGRLSEAFAAALQAERERTRAETWDEAIEIVTIIEQGTPDSTRWREGIRSVIKTLEDGKADCLGDPARARALEAAQLPQGKDK